MQLWSSKALLKTADVWRIGSWRVLIFHLVSFLSWPVPLTLVYSYPSLLLLTSLYEPHLKIFPFCSTCSPTYPIPSHVFFPALIHTFYFPSLEPFLCIGGFASISALLLLMSCHRLLTRPARCSMRPRPSQSLRRMQKLLASKLETLLQFCWQHIPIVLSNK